jgi:DNA modification methylase
MSEPEKSSTYEQHGDVEMELIDGKVYPEFRFEDSPGIAGEMDGVSYPLHEVPGETDEYLLEGEAKEYPEMDFRSLANSLDDEREIPNTGYLTHSIHKHPAVFIPQIPSYLIRQFTTETNQDGDRPTVLDPFSGSGTTGVEAKVNGRDYIGVEINPLSRLVSEVSTSPIPPSLLEHAREEYLTYLNNTERELYEDFDAEFLDRTDKHHWFEDKAIRDLSRIRKALQEFIDSSLDRSSKLTEHEERVVEDLELSEGELMQRLSRWLTLMIANTVFEVSNADPGVSKAYKSKKMRQKIEDGNHPPDVLKTHEENLSESQAKLVDLWNDIYSTDYSGGETQRTLGRFASNEAPGEESGSDLSGNRAHKAEVDVRLGDARTFDFPEYKEEVDIVITSPPYINAMNYYRGSKLRLFWIYDFLKEDEKFDAETLRKSIIGTNSVSTKSLDDTSMTVREVWKGTKEEFDKTRLPHLDEDIQAIRSLDQNNAEKKGYVTWKFFMDGMLKNLVRVYEHLKPGGYYFFVIGENTIGKRLIPSHKYVADIAKNLGKFEGHEGDLDEDDGFRLIGSAWDSITNRDLFQGRKHEGGVIECEWIVMLQKAK